ncbi:MAG: hypothetical protein JSV34_00530 [Candidatus Omnitrophota bacterium]|nr:MAG: hypothetical protein JSV34_00530 [Candidatus Omnitrophota bacterium]
MVCDVCNKNSATVHLTEIVNDKVVEMHICQNCAKPKAKELKGQLSISDFLDNLLNKEDVKSKELSANCSFCGLTLAEINKKGRLGCRSCYETFKEAVTPLLKKLHSATRHRGKFPSSGMRDVLQEPKEEDLKGRLKRAICLQEYEEAARLRDEIKAREKK